MRLHWYGVRVKTGPDSGRISLPQALRQLPHSGLILLLCYDLDILLFLLALY